MFTSTDCFLCLGRRGSGKSYLGGKITECYPRVVIFDTLGEHQEKAGFITVRGFQEFSQLLLEIEQHKQKDFRIVYVFDVESENTEEFNQALRVLWHFGNVHIVIEEVQNFSTTHQMPHWLRQSLLTGRHRNLSLLFTTQRAGECHKTIISQCGHVFAGALHERNDIEYCRSVLGDRAFELSNLKERQFIYFRPSEPVKLVSSDLTELKFNETIDDRVQDNEEITTLEKDTPHENSTLKI